MPSNSPLWARTNSVSAGHGPDASIPSATAVATAGAMIRVSSSPNSPPSLACGFSAATPIRGLRPRSFGNRSFSRRIFSSTAGVVSPAKTSRSAMCRVTCATAMPSPHNTIANSFVSVRSARISVCPGCLIPAERNPSLCSGQVTIPSAAPTIVRSMAWQRKSYAAFPASADTRPGSTRTSDVDVARMHGIRSAADRASDGDDTKLTRAPQPTILIPRSTHSGSPTTTGRACWTSSGQARATISGPMPATSPSVMSRQGEDMQTFYQGRRMNYYCGDGPLVCPTAPPFQSDRSEVCRHGSNPSFPSTNGLVPTLVDLVLGELGGDAPAGEAANTGAATDVAVGHAQGPLDVLLLDVAKRGPEHFGQGPGEVHRDRHRPRRRVHDFDGQVGRQDARPAGGHACAFDRILQLANVPRPRVAQEGLHRLRGDGLRWLARPGKLRSEVVGQ